MQRLPVSRTFRSTAQVSGMAVSPQRVFRPQFQLEAMRNGEFRRVSQRFA